MSMNFRLAIFGGSGYVGICLAKALLKTDPNVIIVLFDTRPPDFDANDLEQDRIVFHRCDITRLESFEFQLKNVVCVFHLASYGMSGREMLEKEKIYRVNIEGTKNLIQACQSMSVPKFIYCSTYNAVFTGAQTLVAVTEQQCMYPRPDEFFDDYSRTKSWAENYVLKSNSTQFRTAAIRPAAIYGEGENRHLPRIIDLARRRLAFFAVGDSSVRCDWVYVDNLVHALILAERSLDQHPGEVYFISDDHPVNNFEFLSQLTDGLDLKNCFRFYVPTKMMFKLAEFIEVFHAFFARFFFTFTPFCTRAEVMKVGVTHYADISKAKTLLGYRVQVSPDQAMKRCIERFTREERQRSSTTTTNLYPFLVLIFLVFLLFFVISSNCFNK